LLERSIVKTIYRDSLVLRSVAHDVLTTLLAYHDLKSDTENYK
jgi:hypothetical protein